MNLREAVVADLAVSIEGDWGLPVTLIGPDRTVYSGLRGQVLYNSRVIDPDSGEQIIVNTPVVSLREASLTRIPQPGERWGVRVPVTPSESAPLADFVMSARPPEHSSLGFLRLYLTKVEL